MTKTNGELFKDFCKKYPDIKVNDYRPLYLGFVDNLEGITVFMDNGDIILYFPKKEAEK